MCSRASCSLQIIDHSCAPEFLAQHKSSITHVLQSSSLNTNHQSLMCYRAPCSTQIINHSCARELLAQHKTCHQSCASWSTPNTNNHIHTSSIIGLCPIYKTNHHVHMQWVLQPNIKIYIKIIIIINRHIPISVRSNIQDITICLCTDFKDLN